MSEKKYVIFKLREEEYGADIENIKEVTEYREVTYVPDAPAYVEGIINLRGDITPIINVEKKLHFPPRDQKELRHKIVVVKGEEHLLGFLVDEVSQVMTLSDQDIEEAPEIIRDSQKKYLRSIAKVGDKMIILIDLMQMLSEEEKESLEDLQA